MLVLQDLLVGRLRLGRVLVHLRPCPPAPLAVLFCKPALQGLGKAPADRQPPFVDAPLAASAWQHPSLLPFPSSRPLGMPRWSTNLCHQPLPRPLLVPVPQRSQGAMAGSNTKIRIGKWLCSAHATKGCSRTHTEFCSCYLVTNMALMTVLYNGNFQGLTRKIPCYIASRLGKALLSNPFKHPFRGLCTRQELVVKGSRATQLVDQKPQPSSVQTRNARSTGHNSFHFQHRLQTSAHTTYSMAPGFSPTYSCQSFFFYSFFHF